MCCFDFTDLESMRANLQGNAVKKGALTLVLANGNKLETPVDKKAKREKRASLGDFSAASLLRGCVFGRFPQLQRTIRWLRCCSKLGFRLESGFGRLAGMVKGRGCMKVLTKTEVQGCVCV